MANCVKNHDENAQNIHKWCMTVIDSDHSCGGPSLQAFVTMVDDAIIFVELSIWRFVPPSMVSRVDTTATHGYKDFQKGFKRLI